MSKIEVKETKPRKDLIAEQVGQNCLIRFKKAQAKIVLSDRVGYHVSDYIYPCMRKTAFSKQTEALGVKGVMGAESVGTLYLGQIVHQHSHLQGFGHEIPMCYDIVKDKSIPFDKDGVPKGMDFDKEGRGISIEGRPLIDFIIGTTDDVVLDDAIANNVIIDKKTRDYKGFVPRQANEQDKEQINLYRLMLNKCKKTDATWGCSLYIDVGERTQKVYSFAYRLDEIDYTLKKLKEKREILIKWQKTGELPARVLSWACDYCSHYLACFSRND